MKMSMNWSPWHTRRHELRRDPKPRCRALVEGGEQCPNEAEFEVERYSVNGLDEKGWKHSYLLCRDHTDAITTQGVAYLGKSNGD